MARANAEIQLMPTRCAVFVNLNANAGRAAQRWAQAAAALLGQLPENPEVVAFRPPTDVEPAVQAMLAADTRAFISAGGDGSANFLLNVLMRQTGENARHLWLGGIGLGSSNDFIKPKQHFIKGLPTRLGWATATVVDVGKAEFRDPAGQWQVRYFIANASLGVTAEANWLFNHGDWFIRTFKNRWTGLAILYTALRTILAFRSYPARVDFGKQTRAVRLSNLAVLKSPFVSGSFRFDDPVQRDDGFLGVNLCLGMSKIELLGTLASLAKGRFRGRPKTLSLPLKGLSVHTQSPVALELDGEVFRATYVHFSVLPQAIGLLGL